MYNLTKFVATLHETVESEKSGRTLPELVYKKRLVVLSANRRHKQTKPYCTVYADKLFILFVDGVGLVFRSLLDNALFRLLTSC